MTRIVMGAIARIDRRPNCKLVQRLAPACVISKPWRLPTFLFVFGEVGSSPDRLQTTMPSLPFALARIPGLTLLSGALAACTAERLLSQSETSPGHTWSHWALADPSCASSSTTIAQRLQWDGPAQAAVEAQHGMLLGRGDPRTRRGKVSTEAILPMCDACAC